ncbi:hypothetical protein BOX15_Mlig005012g7 [Macrostomum lignano]|uniref:Uncharacterized protein n=2 Tax=Macrostomum lignano TaxID=282301 RepID=A0A267G6G1_9PLAT|nr:hypothetical protein BOX15_Mlig005012g7 [Macrostomum lignano]
MAAAYNPDAPLLTLNDLSDAYATVQSSGLIRRTPILTDVDPQLLGLPADVGYRLHLKLECAQLTGSFKPRGLAVQLAGLTGAGSGPKLVTMSAGNYGRSFAAVCQARRLHGLVLMPDSAPRHRVDHIRSQGVLVETCPSSELQSRVDAKVANEGYQFLHPFDDRPLIAGHASLGLELLEQLSQVDTVLLGCGGGGLSAGVAAALALSSKSRLHENGRSADEEPRSPVVYAVEPETACTMRLSFEQDRPALMPQARSIAGGLAPPYAGANAYRHLRHFGARSLLVSDAEIGACQRQLARNLGLIVEPSACAGLAALLFDRLEQPPVGGLCVVLTGRNVSPEDAMQLLAAGDDE